MLAGTIIEANNGTKFELLDDVDFTETDNTGELLADVVISQTDQSGVPTKFIVTRSGFAVSGFRTTESFTIPSTYKAFRTITLGNENVTEIISVRDSEGNTYYEVSSLTQDTVFRRVTNMSRDNDVVPDNIEVIPAPYRFVKEVSLDGRMTTLRFGSGDATSFDVDSIPDPAEISLPLFGRRTFDRFTIDPSALLKSRTLGVAPINTTITVEYRYGGGLTHNIPAETLRNPVDVRLKFPNSPSAAEATRVRASMGTTNKKKATGGEQAPSVADLRAKIPAFRNAQSRIVSAEDLLARIYTLPSNFGRVFRAGVRTNVNNSHSTQLYVVNRDADGRLTVTPDSLKLNLRNYLNPFRLLSDAIDILDAPIVNIQVEYQVVVSPTANRSIVIQHINKRLKRFLDVRDRQIDQPISISDVKNIIFNNKDVLSVVDVNVRNVVGKIGDRTYSDVKYDVKGNTIKGHVFPPPGGIFEVRFPDVDIIGSAV